MSKYEDLIFKSLYKRPNPKYKKLYNKYSVEKPLDDVEIDLLFLPHDEKGYKYILAIVDVASRYKWVIPLKNKSGKNILDGIKTIFVKRKPTQISSDSGSETNNKDILKWCKDNNIKLSLIPTGHHLSIVENFNGQLAKRLLYIQSKNEFNTGKVDSNWIENLQEIVDDMNNKVNQQTKLKPRKAIKQSIITLPNFLANIKDDDKDINFPVNTIVRRILDSDEILDIRTLKIKANKRRITDPYWSWKLYIISSIYRPENGYWYHILRDYNTDIVYPETYNYWSLQKVPNEWLSDK